VPQQTRRTPATSALDNIEAVDTQTPQIGTETVQNGIDDPLADAEAEVTDPVDRLRQPLDQISAGIQQPLRSAGGAVGDVTATFSLLPEAERAITGDTQRTDAAFRGAGEEAAAAADIPGFASASIGAGDFVVRGTDDDRTRTEATIDAGSEGIDSFVSAAQSNPAETTGRTAGALAGGFGVGTAAVRGGQRAARGVDTPDVNLNTQAFATDQRGQVGIGRRRDRDSSDNAITAEDLDVGFGPDPTDLADQRLISSENPRLTSSQVGADRIRRQEIEAGRRQEAPADRASPSRPDRDVFSAAPDAEDIATVSRSPDTGPAPGTQPRPMTSTRAVESDLSTVERMLAADQRRRTTDFDLRAADRARGVPSTDLRATVAPEASSGVGPAAGLGGLSAINDPSGIGDFQTPSGREDTASDSAAATGLGAGVTGVFGGAGADDMLGFGDDSDVADALGFGSDVGPAGMTGMDSAIGTEAATDIQTRVSTDIGQSLSQDFGLAGQTAQATRPAGAGSSGAPTSTTPTSTAPTTPGPTLGQFSFGPISQTTTPTRPAPRVPRWDEDDELSDEPEEFGFEFDDELFDSGIADASDFFGNGR